MKNGLRLLLFYGVMLMGCSILYSMEKKKDVRQERIIYFCGMQVNFYDMLNGALDLDNEINPFLETLIVEVKGGKFVIKGTLRSAKRDNGQDLNDVKTGNYIFYPYFHNDKEQSDVLGAFVVGTKDEQTCNRILLNQYRESLRELDLKHLGKGHSNEK